MFLHDLRESSRGWRRGEGGLPERGAGEYNDAKDANEACRRNLKWVSCNENINANPQRLGNSPFRSQSHRAACLLHAQTCVCRRVRPLVSRHRRLPFEHLPARRLCQLPCLRHTSGLHFLFIMLAWHGMRVFSPCACCMKLLPPIRKPLPRRTCLACAISLFRAPLVRVDVRNCQFPPRSTRWGRRAPYSSFHFPRSRLSWLTM